MLQLFEKPSQTVQRYPSFSGPLTEYDDPSSSGSDLVTELELSSLTTVTIVSIWIVMPMSGPPLPDTHSIGELFLLAHMSFVSFVRSRR